MKLRCGSTSKSRHTICLAIVFLLLASSAVKTSWGSGVFSSLVWNGSLTTEKVWPWVGALVDVPSKKIFCSAILISLKAALSVAHCFQDKYSKTILTAGSFEVHFGRYRLEESDEDARLLEPIVTIAIHPDWDPKSSRYDADICLLIAGKEMEYSRYISPISLPSYDMVGAEGMIAGYGLTGDNTDRIEGALRQISVKRVSQEECLIHAGSLGNFSSTRTFCAEGDGRPCKGDSGSSFHSLTNDGWILNGIVSSSEIIYECPVGRFSVYTKVFSYRGWISDKLEGEKCIKFSNESTLTTQRSDDSSKNEARRVDCSILRFIPKESSKATCNCPTHFKMTEERNKCSQPEEYLIISHRNSFAPMYPTTEEDATEAQIQVSANNIKSIEFDLIDNYIYVIDGRTIKRLLHDGSNMSLVIGGSGSFSQPFDIALDSVDRYLLYTCSYANTINIYNLDDHSPVGILDLGYSRKPRLIAVDPFQRNIFFTDVGLHKGIIRARIDGSNQVPVVNDLNGITSLELDLVSKMLYFSHGKTIEYVDSMGQRKVLTSSESSVSSIAAFPNFVYWTTERGELQKLTKFENVFKTVKNSSFITGVVAVWNPEKQNFTNHPCSPLYKKCSHICIASSDKTDEICSCPKNMMLLNDRRNCTSYDEEPEKSQLTFWLGCAIFIFVVFSTFPTFICTYFVAKESV